LNIAARFLYRQKQLTTANRRQLRGVYFSWIIFSKSVLLNLTPNLNNLSFDAKNTKLLQKILLIGVLQKMHLLSQKKMRKHEVQIFVQSYSFISTSLLYRPV
jgi:hypothetical protein